MKRQGSEAGENWFERVTQNHSREEECANAGPTQFQVFHSNSFSSRFTSARENDLSKLLFLTPKMSMRYAGEFRDKGRRWENQMIRWKGEGEPPPPLQCSGNEPTKKRPSLSSAGAHLKFIHSDSRGENTAFLELNVE